MILAFMYTDDMDIQYIDGRRYINPDDAVEYLLTNRIWGIKSFRKLTGCSLREAKDAMDQIHTALGDAVLEACGAPDGGVEILCAMAGMIQEALSTETTSIRRYLALRQIREM